MLRIAVVEDEDAAAEALCACIRRYGEETGEEFLVSRFSSADAFLTPYSPDCQIVFMDIQMPGTDGMEASRRLRRLDSDVALIFVTNLAQYAINGYEVGALDFMLKPVNYYSFRLKMARAVRAVRSNLNERFVVRNDKGNWYIDAAQLCYVEVLGHNLRYHTTERVVEVGGTLKQEEKRLENMGFFRCNYCYLVNVRYVTNISGNLATVHGETLEISRNRKKEFLKRLSEYYGEGGCRADA